ncbi:MAG: Copper/silver-translocating P-type ATPase [Candidatus Woesebacteria bacterium GW2011_GWC1_42_9]|nr:MAG: Copper/silver-translocating P-type ATPase [Candidatus Woesebacteria bacterium GW2011_GWC1_42_9]
MKETIYYTCPMHPEVQEKNPGECPKCGMALVPVEKEVGHKEMLAGRSLGEGWSFWEKFKMSMTMAMGMEHAGLAGREMAKLMEEDIRNKFLVALILTLPIIVYSPLGTNILGLRLPEPIPASWIMFLLATPVYFYSGWIFLYSTYKALQAKTLNMAVLIAVGITTAYVFSVVLTLLGSQESFYEAAAMLTTFVLFGHWMEMKSRRGTTDALQALFDLVPPQARLWRDGKETLVSTSEVKLGDILILKPGDKVPVDGEIIEGETAIDESLVTGESALAQIVKMVETAQNSKAPGQKIADRFARYLVVVAVGGGLLTFVVWFFVLGQPLLFALTFAISTVVIACPDALGLATPTAVAVGTGLGAKHNILIKDAATLEQVSKIQAVVMDKTGTLTEGKPRITDVVAANGFTQDQIIQLNSAAEKKSSHPLSSAVLEEAKRRKISVSNNVEKFKNLAGHGVEAVVDGRHVLVGTVKLMDSSKVDISPLQNDIDRLLLEGKTIMILAVDNKIAGVAAALDPVKENAKQAIVKMKALGLEVAMITGDNKKTAEAIGKELNIDRVFSEVLPEDKASYVKKLQEEGKFTAMVGDGVNDAPALAQADIGIAIGAGTDVAIETAKVVLMKSDPADVLRAIKLSKATVRKMKENLVWASVYNLLAIPVAAGVLYPSFGITLRPEFSALLMSISSIIVATNAILLNRAEKDLVSV